MSLPADAAIDRPAATAEPPGTTAPVIGGESESETQRSRWYWKDALRFESADKNLTFKIGGRIHGDWAVFDTRQDIEEDVADFQEGTEVRRGRLDYSGMLFEHIEFKTEIELSKRNIEGTDVYVGLVDLPVIGDIRVGHFKEPFGLDELSGSNYMVFEERPAASNAFVPVRNTGIMMHDRAFDERLTWAIGFYRETDEFFNGEISDGLSLTGRVTALPWYEEDGRKLLHLGIAWSHRRPGGDEVRFRAKPNSDIAPRLVDTGPLLADHVDLLGIEAAMIYGPLSLQSEYMHAFVNQVEEDDLEFGGFYVQAGYFLTGEHRNYSTSKAAFDILHPKRNFGEDGGWGAWEAGVRYSYVTLNDGEVRGGRMNEATAGLNWYLNPNVRISWDYTYADVQESGFAHIYGVRMQITF